MEILAAVAQIDPQLAKPAENTACICAMLAEAAGQGAQLIVFPECATTGYGFPNLESARQVAELIPGPSTDAMVTACRDNKLPQGGPYAVFGLLEQDSQEHGVYNSAVLVGPDGLIGKYRTGFGTTPLVDGIDGQITADRVTKIHRPFKVKIHSRGQPADLPADLSQHTADQKSMANTSLKAFGV